MAHASSLPCDGDGVCMVCRQIPTPEQTLSCKTCTTPWHSTCLSTPSPRTLGEMIQWDCPDCAVPVVGDGVPPPTCERGSLVAAIREIEADESLTELEKAKRRQKLLSNGRVEDDESGPSEKKKNKGEDYHVLDVLGDNFNCSFCMKLPERPVTTPCGHNFCLKCFQKWIGQGKHTCAKCRTAIPPKMASQPRINSSLVVAIRMAKLSKSSSSVVQEKVYHFVHNQDRPDKAYTTERAKKTGKANACSGKIFVTVPPDHFGPILAENDPERNQGVLVGECWEDRMECRQWGAHLPHVAGIAGQSDYGAQSVALSGGYEDDEDHGEWFLYTGSGGRDLSGNKRTNKSQSFDQKFDKSNEALRVSCKKGYPVRVVRDHISIMSYKVGKGDRVRFWEDIWIGDRALCEDFGGFYVMSNRKNHPVRDFVVMENGVASWDIDLRQLFNDWEIDALATLLARLGIPPLLNQEEDELVQIHDASKCFTVKPWSHKEKRSSYAPETGVRYDGVYRIEKCWRKVGIQGFKVCRYLFVRCDNEPAPWTSDEHGDRPRPLPAIKELKAATDITERKEEPSWDYDDKDNCWKWKKLPPGSRKSVDTANPEERKRARKAIKQAQNLSVRERLLKEFNCLICRKVLSLPVTTPCAHNFCKSCLEGAFSGQAFVRERFCASSRSLRVKKNVMKCPAPACVNDIADFLKDMQVNRELMGVIESLQLKTNEENAENMVEEKSAGADERNETMEEDHRSNVVQDSPEQKSRRVYKRRKGNNEEAFSSKPSDASTENAKQSPVRGADDVGGGMPDVEMKVDNKTPESESELKTEGEVTSEGNNSPSSPLHVRSDGDE